MKHIMIVPILALVAVGCGTAKPGAGNAAQTGNARNTAPVVFLDKVSLQPDAHHVRTGASTGSVYESAEPLPEKHAVHPLALIEQFTLLQFKYAILLDAPVEYMNNQKLLAYMDEWYGTRYRYGGSAKTGIDCSAFVASVMSAVYGINNLPRMSKDQYVFCKRVKRSELQEGDLVFFHTNGRHKGITHVGLYLQNNKFIHASISGVMISSLEDGYYSEHYAGAGTVW